MYNKTHVKPTKREIEDRMKLLKAGFSGRQVEVIYTLLNGFEVLEMNWQNTIQPDKVE